MNMTPEDRVNEYYRWVLSKIKEQLLVTLKDKPVLFKFSHVIAAGVPNKQTEKDILAKLEEEGGLKVRDDPFLVPVPRDNEIYLDIFQPKFDEIYIRYYPEKPAKKEAILVSADDPVEVILADLEAKYADISQEKNDNNFYLKVADYGRYLISHPAIEPLISTLIEQSKKDLLAYKNACDIFIKKWKILAKDLVETAGKAKIEDDPISPFISQISRINNNLNQDPSYDDDYLGYYYDPYIELIKRFKDEGKLDLISGKHLYTDEKRGVEKILLEAEYEKAREEWEKFKKARELQVWWAHYKIMRLAHGVFQLRDKDTYFRNDSMIDSIYLYDFNQVSQGGTAILLRTGTFEEYLNRLHKYLIPRLKQMGNIDKALVDVSVPGGFLKYYPEDSIAEFKGVLTKPLKGKGKALLDFLNANKGVPHAIQTLSEKCNPDISNPKSYIKGHKDILDCVNGIKKKLKVKNGEYFPIEKVGNNWIWKQK